MLHGGNYLLILAYISYMILPVISLLSNRPSPYRTGYKKDIRISRAPAKTPFLDLLYPGTEHIVRRSVNKRIMKRDWLKSRLSISIPMDIISHLIVEAERERANERRRILREKLRKIG